MEDKICDFCREKIVGNDYYNIYCLQVETDIENHYLGMATLLKDLADYAMEKSYHISSSQILILRPDIVKEFLIAKLIKENILNIKFKEYNVCYVCYDDYKGLVPLI